MSIRPTEDRVLVIPDTADTMTTGGIVVPDIAQEKPARGKVVAVGPGKHDEAGERVPLAVKVGDTVLWSRWGGVEIRVHDVEHRILRETELLGVVEDGGR